MVMAKRDVTIYSPGSASLFQRGVGRTGGAERQMALLADAIARRDHRVALVVFPVPDPVADAHPRLALVERRFRPRSGGIVGTVLEAVSVVRALVAAGGRVTVVRSGTPIVGFIALYSLIWRRRFVFSSANNFDFLSREDMSRVQLWLYRFGVRRADVTVVQSSEQIELARRAFPKIKTPVRIPSFADEPSDSTLGEGEAFVWVGRLVDYKRPLLYAELAAAVPDARFVLVPHLPQEVTQEQRQVLEELERLAERMDNLEIGQGLPHAALVETLDSAVAVVNTSSFEGMPNTFLEAWGRGVPVLTYSFDPDGVVAERGLGISAEGDWDNFVAGARKLWKERADRVEIAQRARSYLREVHSTEVVGAQWEELLASLGAFETP